MMLALSEQARQYSIRYQAPLPGTTTNLIYLVHERRGSTPMTGVFRQSNLFAHIRRASKPVRFLSLFSFSILCFTPTGSARRMCLFYSAHHDRLITRRGGMPSMIRFPKPCRAVPLPLSHVPIFCRWARGSNRPFVSAHLPLPMH